MQIWCARVAVGGVMAMIVGCGTSQTPSAPSPQRTVTPDINAPPASAGHNLVYATHLGMVVLVNAALGGSNTPAASTPTRVWAWTGTEWRLLDSSGPPVRNLAGVTYDTRRQTLVMHGGTYDLGRSYPETWEWSSGWRQLTSTGPGVRDHTQLAFDPDRGRAVLFGGSAADPNTALSDTWEYDGLAWTRVADTGPVGRVHHSMQFDHSSRRITLFGGNIPGVATQGETWAWDGARWRSTGVAVARSHACMTFDRNLGGLIVLGGSQSGLDMLVNRGGSWTPIRPATEPPARLLCGVAFDERRNVAVLFGGSAPGGTLLNDTWEFDGTTWRQR